MFNSLEEENPPEEARIKMMGVGGSLAVEYLMAGNLAGVELICADVDAGALICQSSNKVIRLGQSSEGIGHMPEDGRKAAETAAQDIRTAIQGAHMLFITVAPGCITGAGAAPVIASLAREMGILTVVGVVTAPFDWKGRRGMTGVDAHLAELEATADAVIVIRYAKLLELLGDEVTPEQALAHAGAVLKTFVRDTALVCNVPGFVGVDFEDVRTVLNQPGKAVIGTALAHGPDRARIAAEQAVASPLLDDVNLTNADSVLVLISAAQGGFRLSDTKSVMDTIRSSASPEAHVIYGTTYDDELDDAIRVTVIVTGLTRRDV